MINKAIAFTLPFIDNEKRGWRLRISKEDEEHIRFDLHWNDKVVPTHELFLTRAEFRAIAQDFGFIVEKED